MNKTFSYLPYLGVNSFAYFGCYGDDIKVASEVANVLVRKGFRLCLDARGNKKEISSIDLSNAIDVCDGAIIFISKKSIESLAYRNIINNLISLKKPIVFIKIGEFDLAYGLEMQLSNLNVISYVDVEKTINSILDYGVLTQDMIGEGMEEKPTNNKLIIMISMIVVCLLIFVVVSKRIIDNLTSPEYLLKDANNLDYLNISDYGTEAISILRGKNFDELDLSKGKFDSLKGLEDINIKTINVSDIDASLSTLTKIKGLEVVKISQKQIGYAEELNDAGLRVIITH